MTNKGINGIKNKFGWEQVAGLISPSATLEEAYLFQNLLHGLGISNIDYRLREQSFSDQGYIYNSDCTDLSDIERSDYIILVGCNIRAEQPIIAHRMRQAAVRGTKITNINFFATDLLMPVESQLTVNVKSMLDILAGIAKELLITMKYDDVDWLNLLSKTVP